MSIDTANTYTFRTNAGQRLVVRAESYESALVDLADLLGISLMSAKIAPSRAVCASFENNAVPFRKLRANVA